MRCWEWFNTAAGAASLIGVTVAVVLGVVSWRITRVTDRLISQSHTDTRALIERAGATTQAIRERMDQRADEGHREALQVIQTLRP